MQKIEGKKELKELELLAPAGSYETFRAVIQAGADAVYLGGNLFGARAYANNFSEEELCQAIDYAHLHGRKLFLTVNTLFKEKELEQELYRYLLPYYKQGLDAVIVQDMGVFGFLRKEFPDLPIHTSTQMTVTNAYGAKLMKDMGASRVVTARELSFADIRDIYEKVDVEIESFVHGALCYCYSGQCLLSSMLGGRSGNRGRCAQPCRLPYEVFDQNKKALSGETFILSPKDLCTIEFLPQLAESGVYSYKIEGRMKQAEYAAGVVSIYREYMDRYLAEGATNYKVTKEDMQKLYDFGNRSGFTKGYYLQHNGKNMITFEKPNHAKGNEALQKEVRETYIETERKEKIKGILKLKKDFPAILTIQDGDIMLTLEGDVVQSALKQPLLPEKVEGAIRKTGNTPFEFEELQIEMDSDCFLPVQSLKQLRRDALEQLLEKRLQGNRREIPNEKVAAAVRETSACQETASYQVQSEHTTLEAEVSKEELSVSIEQRKQLSICLEKEYVTSVYLDSTCYLRSNLMEQLEEDVTRIHTAGKKAYFILPAVFRTKTAEFYEKQVTALQKLELDGFVVKSLDELSFLKEQELLDKEVVLDQGLYTYNNRSQKVFEQVPYVRNTIPFELNRHEIAARENAKSEMVLYGYLPLMISAQCVHANSTTCDKKPQITFLKDRYGKFFPVKNQCMECYNVLYNTVPLALFGAQKELRNAGIRKFRLMFTIENEDQMKQILECYESSRRQEKIDLSSALKGDYTKGHFKRGVE
ncbi:MAG: DUF3656 domain-containing protein [Roseburia sp.]